MKLGNAPPLTGIGIEICFEHHARERWPWIADRAAEAGVAFARLGVFVWDLLEPEEDRFDFAPLAEWMRLLAERGIDTVLTTPTASPPDWMCAKYPEIVPVKIDGGRLGTGGRRHTCPTSPAYRARCEGIVRAMAQRFASAKSIVGWQIDNEIGHPFCYCPRCHHAFGQWLGERFGGDIGEFNFRVGQSFWARSSRSFAEIPLPTEGGNPSLHHIYGLFMDKQIRDCWGSQREWIRQAGIDVPITTNAMLMWYGYDHERMFAPLDLITGDAYPNARAGGMYRDHDYPGIAFYSAFQRGAKHGANFGIMETSCTPAGEGQPFPPPGEMTYWTFCFLAGGARFVHFFRLDTSPAGHERGCGLVQASGALPPIFAELQSLCARVKPLEASLAETTVPTAPVGILYSHPSHLALQHRPMIDEFTAPFGNGYTVHLARHLRALASQNLPADVVHLGDDFGKYRVLIATGLVVIDTALAAKLAAYVEAGGVLLVGPWCGYLDENAKQWEIPLPAHLDHVTGTQRITSEAFTPAEATIEFVPAERSALPRLQVASVADQLTISPQAAVLAHLEGHPAGRELPALVRHRFGAGVAYTLAAFFDEYALVSFYRSFLSQHDIRPELSVPPSIHYTTRVGPGYELWFFLNSSHQPIELDLPATFEHLSTRYAGANRLTFASRECKVLRRQIV